MTSYSDRTPGRAGAYQLQPDGNRTFIPASLPPSPLLKIAGSLQALLSDADRALGKLDGSIETLPNPNLFVFMYIRKEAVLSSQIEGTQSSLNDLLEVEAKLFGRKNQPNDVYELVNYIAAMDYGLDELPELPVSVRLIKAIHQRLLQGGRGSDLMPGDLRNRQNWIGAQGRTIAEATFVPPPHQLVPDLLSDLEKFIHAKDDLPHLIKIGLVHAQFETIHPFLDGNGRMGRLLITLLLIERGLLSKPVLYLSYYFKRHKQQYYDLLQAVREEGDWESWMAFFLQGVSEVSSEAVDTARRILVLREENRSDIARHLGRTAGNGHKVLESLFERPIVSVLEVSQLLELNYASANQLVARLVELGILREITGHNRNRRFSYEPYIRLFE